MLFSLLFVVSCQNENLKETLRDHSLQLFGEELTTKLFGKSQNISMPQIPELKYEAHNLNLNDQKKHTLDHPYYKGLGDEKYQTLNYQFLKEVSLAVRNIAIEQVELQNFMRTLSQGASREGVYRSMVLDPYYQSLEQNRITMNDDSRVFMERVLNAFVGRKVNNEVLKELPLYTAKKMLVEKLLEVVDAYQDEEEFHRWYAYLMHNLVESHPKAFTHNYRKTSNIKWNYEWAQKMPRDIVKSEVFIRVHMVMNYLQKGQV